LYDSAVKSQVSRSEVESLTDPHAPPGKRTPKQRLAVSGLEDAATGPHRLIPLPPRLLNERAL